MVALGLPVDLPRFGSSECCSALMADGDWEKLATVEKGQHSDPPSERPLLLAASLGQVEVARLLLQAGADCNRVGQALCETPLHVASANRQLDMTCLLLEFHACVN